MTRDAVLLMLASLRLNAEKRKAPLQVAALSSIEEWVRLGPCPHVVSVERGDATGYCALAARDGEAAARYRVMRSLFLDLPDGENLLDVVVDRIRRDNDEPKPTDGA